VGAEGVLTVTFVSKPGIAVQKRFGGKGHFHDGASTWYFCRNALPEALVCLICRTQVIADIFFHVS